MSSKLYYFVPRKQLEKRTERAQIDGKTEHMGDSNGLKSPTYDP